MKKSQPSQNIFVTVLVISVIFFSIFILHNLGTKPKPQPQLKVQVKFKHKVSVPKPTKVKPRPKVSFVIDDWGYNLNNIDLILDMDIPITIAVLPHLVYSHNIVERVKEDGKGNFDIILHLPMESKSGKTPEANTISRNMEKEEIASILRNDIEDMPGIIGVSNHQGSRITEDRPKMKIIMAELKKKDLFFLDSRTTPVSVCSSIAHDIGLRYAQRDIFLDLAEKRNPEQYRAYVKKQIKKLAEIAKEKGSAVGIGHDKRLTLEVIKESIPDMERENIKIVPLKELVK